MGQVEDALVRQVMSVLLYQRRFHRATRPALDVLASVFEAAIFQLLCQARRAAELDTNHKVAFAAVHLELLRLSRPLYIRLEELGEYGRLQPALECSSVMEERGLITSQFCVMPRPRVDPKLIRLVKVEEEKEKEEAEAEAEAEEEESVERQEMEKPREKGERKGEKSAMHVDST